MPQKGYGMKQPNTVPVRIDRALYEAVAALAADQHRKVRQQIEMMLEQAMERQEPETRGGKR